MRIYSRLDRRIIPPAAGTRPRFRCIPVNRSIDTSQLIAGIKEVAGDI